MTKTITIFIFAFLITCFLHAQEFVELSVGPSYSNQVYYSFDGDEQTKLENESWDLAFATGSGSVGIHYNESAALSSTSILEFYLAPSDNFSENFDPDLMEFITYNGTSSWEEGAFNRPAVKSNPFDFGWGLYNPTTHDVEGSRVFALKLRDDTWLKIKVEILSGGIYTVRIADLDGFNERTLTINKADYSDSPFAYYSFDTDETTASPANWDLFVGRYLFPLNAGSGDTLEYNVTGILSGLGVELAEARGIDPDDIDETPYLDSLGTDVSIIGHDWKEFNLGTFSWSIAEDLAYFVKLGNNHLWKMVFVDFEGSSTGTMVFEKTDLGKVTAVIEANSNFVDYSVFPNPVVDEINLSFSLKEQQNNMQLYLISVLGQRVWDTQIQGSAGLNAIRFNRPNVPSGLYQLVLGQGADLLTTNVFFK